MAVVFSLKMKDHGILIVSFGTTNKNAEEKSILALEKYIRERYHNSMILHAYTSTIIRKIMKKRGETILSIEEALDILKENGIREVSILPTHLIYGEEYEKIQGMVDKYRLLFEDIRLGAPLLKMQRI